jgi:hypothetical protein
MYSITAPKVKQFYKYTIMICFVPKVLDTFLDTIHFGCLGMRKF